jgi:hypothetical protein
LIGANASHGYTAFVSAPSMMRLVPDTRLATGTCKEHDASGDLLCRAHPAGWVERHRGLEKIGVATLDVLPDPALEIGVPWRDLCLL